VNGEKQRDRLRSLFSMNRKQTHTKTNKQKEQRGKTPDMTPILISHIRHVSQRKVPNDDKKSSFGLFDHTYNPNRLTADLNQAFPAILHILQPSPSFVINFTKM